MPVLKITLGKTIHWVGEMQLEISETSILKDLQDGLLEMRWVSSKVQDKLNIIVLIMHYKQKSKAFFTLFVMYGV